jgi:hypothetical protein
MAFDISTAKPETPTTQGFDMTTAKPEKPADPNTPWYKDLQRGVGESAIRTVLGAGELLGFEQDETSKKTMQMMRDDVSASGGWGTAGNIVGDMAQLAAPAAGLAKAVKFLGRGAKTLLAADTGLAAGYGATKMPNEGETRKANAMLDATGALIGGGVVGPLLRKAVTGINVTEGAKKLMDKGVYLTPDKASESVFPRAAAYTMQVTPFMAKGVKEAGERSSDSWNKVLLSEAAPIEKVTESGFDGIKQLKSQFNDAYSTAWGKANPPSTASLLDIIDEGALAESQLGGSSGLILKKIIKDVSKLDDTYTSGAVKELDNVFRKRLTAAATRGDDALFDTLSSMRAKLRAAGGEDSVKALEAVDGKYGEFVAIRDAGSAVKSMKEGGNIDPDTLISGVKSAGGKTRSATGAAPLNEFSQESIKTLGRKEPNPIIDLMKGLAVNTPNVLPLQTAGQTLLGRTAPQKLLQKGYNSPLANTLREYGGRGSVVGTAQNN